MAASQGYGSTIIKSASLKLGWLGYVWGKQDGLRLGERFLEAGTRDGRGRPLLALGVHGAPSRHSHEDASCAGPGALAFKPLPGDSGALGPRSVALTAG